MRISPVSSPGGGTRVFYFNQLVPFELYDTAAMAALSPTVRPAPDACPGITHYAEATLENLVVTNYGDVQLTRRLDNLAEGIAGASMVTALLEAPDGTLYAGTGPGGVIVRIRQGQAERFELPGVGSIFSLALDAEGNLLAGTGGEIGKVIRVNLDAPEPQLADVFAADHGVTVPRDRDARSARAAASSAADRPLASRCR